MSCSDAAGVGQLLPPEESVRIAHVPPVTCAILGRCSLPLPRIAGVTAHGGAKNAVTAFEKREMTV